MSKFIRTCVVSAAALAGPLTIAPLSAAPANLPEAIAVSGGVLVTTVQAAGTQIYMPAVVAAPVEAPAVHVIVLPRDHPKKKKQDGKPKTPPSAEPKTPPAQPKQGGVIVRDHREKAPIVRDHRKPLQGGVTVRDTPDVRDHCRQPVVNDHRAQSQTRDRRTNVPAREQRGSVLNGPRVVLCGTLGRPLCRSR